MNKVLSCFLFIVIVISLHGCVSTSKNESVKSDTNSSQEMKENKTLEEDKSEEVLSKEPESEELKNIDKPSKENELKNQVKEESVAKKRIVVIDPGHSSAGNKGMEKQSPDSDVMKIKDPGGAQGISTNIPEYVVAMKVATKLKYLLEQHNIIVIMTKTKDAESPGNIERAEIGNKNNADLSIRIHCDSADSQSARGASV
jgi:N-acetylmuramoyl-L-alanine amidase